MFSCINRYLLAFNKKTASNFFHQNTDETRKMYTLCRQIRVQFSVHWAKDEPFLVLCASNHESKRGSFLKNKYNDNIIGTWLIVCLNNHIGFFQLTSTTLPTTTRGLWRAFSDRSDSEPRGGQLGLFKWDLAIEWLSRHNKIPKNMPPCNQSNPTTSVWFHCFENQSTD